MKKKLLTFGIAALFLTGAAFFTSCGNSQSNDEQQEQMDSTEQNMNKETTTPDTNQTADLYACPMHPEYTGKKGDECPKCKMPLEKVVNDQTAELYACPMHPEITGKKGEVCSKCQMDLEPVKKDNKEDSHE